MRKPPPPPQLDEGGLPVALLQHLAKNNALHRALEDTAKNIVDR